MAEYWKSTPKYWCKFCNTFVRDTPFEKQQHEATGKHQANIQRSLRGLHKNQERSEREKQRAKDEVARLNGLVSASGTSSSAPAGAPWKKATAPAPPSTSKPATIEDRKKQIAQLADMGVAIPDEFRKDMSIAGDWQVVSERFVDEDVKKGSDDASKGLVQNIGVRKRKYEGQEEEEKAGGIVRQRGWGSAYKSYPGSKGTNNDSDDIEALLSSAKPKATTTAVESEPSAPAIKKEEPADENGITAPTVEETERAKAEVKIEEETEATPRVVFKKRKPKGFR